MKYAKVVILVAGILCISLALFVQGILPAIIPESHQKAVTAVTRTNLGLLKWTWTNSTPYKASEQRGRAVYIREGCWYCHSQYVRPVTGETRRWGPVSQSGEYAFDLPHLFSTRRIGPDLTRVGLKYSDDWHYAHHWNPRMIVPESNMPAFPWLFEEPIQADLEEGEDGELQIVANEKLKNLFNYESEKIIAITPNEEGLAFVREFDGVPTLVLGQYAEEFNLTSIKILIPKQDLIDLVAYLQKLGTNRGKWRDVFEPQNVFATQFEIPKSDEWVEHGKEVYSRRCVGCHGEKGNGNGPASTFFNPRPRDFTTGTFKFRSTESGMLPTNGDLFRTLTMGLRGTAMPTWHMLPEKDRWAVIQYIKTFSDEWEDEEFVAESQPISIGTPPEPSPELLEKGKEAYILAKCWQCHGGPARTVEGEEISYPFGNGPSANELEDDWGFPILPTDFTKGIFKSGPTVRDIFKTMSTGLNGTPMPSYSDILDEDQRWAISYFVLSLSAYRQPGTGEPMEVSEDTKLALDSPEVQASSSEDAYKPPEFLIPRFEFKKFAEKSEKER